jgi:hypothetical protein
MPAHLWYPSTGVSVDAVEVSEEDVAIDAVIFRN